MSTLTYDLRNQRLELVAVALESGKYHPGRGLLCRMLVGRHGGPTRWCYCVMGVFCEVFVEHNPGVISVDIETPMHSMQPRKMFNRTTTHLPDAIAEWFGVTNMGHLRGQLKCRHTLIELNDDLLPGFDVFAAIIRADFLAETIDGYNPLRLLQLDVPPKPAAGDASNSPAA